jgi:hypothetical protein
MTEAIGITKYCFEVPLNGITSVPNFMKIYHAVQKILVGDTQTDKPVFGNRLKMYEDSIILSEIKCKSETKSKHVLQQF